MAKFVIDSDIIKFFVVALARFRRGITFFVIVVSLVFVKIFSK